MSDVEMEQEVEETPPVDVRPFLFCFYTNVMKIIYVSLRLCLCMAARFDSFEFDFVCVTCQVCDRLTECQCQ